MRGLRLHTSRGHACAAGTHSRLSDGRTLCWQPGDSARAGHAVDGELADQAVPDVIARRLGPGVDDPWGRWTRAEVCAKLADVPILVWITTRDWPPAGDVEVDGTRIRLVTHQVAGVVISLGKVVGVEDS